MIRRAALVLLGLGLSGCSDDCASQRCPEALVLACTGPATPARLSSPSGDSCAWQGDTPSAGFPVGVTTVRFRAGDGASCSTRVTVTDVTAPSLSCADLPRVLRASRDPTPTPVPSATDTCTAHVAVTAEPSQLTDRGSVAVTFTATDAGGNHASCAATLEVRNAFAPAGLRVAHAALSDAGTAVTLVWDHPPDSDATGYRVERAPAPTGPWTAVADTDAHATRYVEALLPDAQDFYRVVALVDDADGGATAPVRALGLAAVEYDLGVQPVPGLSLAANAMSGTPSTRSAPLHAIVRHPSDLTAGPFPLVLLMHGNHGNCRPGNYDYDGSNPYRDDVCTVTNTGACRSGTPTPNAAGLAYLAETLAAHGYIAVSVDANALNCRDGARGARADGYIAQRAQLLIEHLRRWRAWNAAPADPFDARFVGRVDLGRVGLFGHSRGAEAVAEVPQTLAASEDVDGITLGAVFSLAPTSFDAPQAGTVPFATLVPVCDGDVYTYNGVQLYDRTLRHDGDAAPSVQIFMARADHDYFSTEWRFDDNATGIASCSAGILDGPEVQQAVLEATVAAWFDGTLPEGASLEPWLRAVGDVPPGIELHSGAETPLDLRRSYSAPRVARIADFAGADATHDLLGGLYGSSGGFAPMSPAVCTGVSARACDAVYSVMEPEGPVSVVWPHHDPLAGLPRRSAMALDWSAPDATLTLDLAADEGTFDASAFRALSLRVASRASVLNPPELVSRDFEVRLVDADGRRGVARASEVVTVPHLYPSRLRRAVLQTVRFTLDGLAARATPALDLHRLRRVEVGFSVDGHASGSMLIDDVEFSE